MKYILLLICVKKIKWLENNQKHVAIGVRKIIGYFIETRLKNINNN